MFFDLISKKKCFLSSCRTLKTSKSDESYIPCTLAYIKVSIIILFNEQFKVNKINKNLFLIFS